MKRAVILDVDGTLVDSNDAHARAWVEAFADDGITVPYDAVRRAIGMGGDKLMPSVAGVDEESPQGQRISKRRGEIFSRDKLPSLRGFPGARELLQQFLDDGFTLAVASSAKKDELGPLLDAAGVRDLIEAQTSSDDADRSKPDPDIVSAAVQKAGVDPAHAVMLGDTPYDVEAARRAGIRVVAFECGGWSARDLAADAVYADAAHLLREYARSIFAQVAAGGRR